MSVIENNLMKLINRVIPIFIMSRQLLKKKEKGKKKDRSKGGDKRKHETPDGAATRADCRLRRTGEGD